MAFVTGWHFLCRNLGGNEMSREYNVKQVSTGQIVATGVASVGSQIAHPQNCKTECPYGRNRAFCFPCMAKILSEQKKRG